MMDARILRNIRVWDRKTQTSVLIDLDVEVEVDINYIGQQLAPKAYNNKARKSQALHGLVEVRVRGTKATPVEGAA
jgi:hypothetical protein